MFFSRINLFRNAIVRHFASALVVGLAACNAAPQMVFAAPQTDLSEYEEWGLTPPQGAGDEAASEDAAADEATPLVDQFFDAVRRNHEEQARQEEARQQPGADPEAVKIATAFEQAAVYVYAIMENGDKYRVVGWVIDAEEGIVMTEFDMLSQAETIAVVFPNMPGVPEGEKLGSVAKLLPTNGEMGISYLKIVKMPEQPLVSLSVGRPMTAQRPVSQHSHPQPTSRNRQDERPPMQVNSPIVGRWVLQHQGQGGQLYIEAVFNAQGQFAMQVSTLDNYGNRTQESQQGQFSVQGSNLVLQTNEGTESLPFWFENGMLMVNYLELDTTLCFQKG